MEKTFAMIKPDAVRNRFIGEITARYEKAGLTIRAMKLVYITKREAQKFYDVHKDRPFFDDLTDFMSSGPVVALVLEGEDAIKRNRELMGATNPAEAEEGTIRKDFADSIDANAVHGSDAPETAAQEIRFFFAELDLV